MNAKTYLWCPECGRLTEAEFKRGALGSRIRCKKCGHTEKPGRGMGHKRCPDCAGEIHAPARLIASIPCPCAAREAKTYACCPECGVVAPVKITGHLLGKRGECGRCGAKMEMNMNNTAVCPDCGSTLFGQRRKASALVCPCEKIDFMEDRETFPPPVSPPPPLRCSCGGWLSSAGADTLCPVCGKVYSPAEISAMEYFRRHGHSTSPITLAWDSIAEPDHIIYIHPHGGCVPPKSVLLVEENQLAIYRTAGRYHVAQPGGPYTVFSDTRTEQERIEAAYTEITGEDILLQLDTRIIFFDSRYHEQRCRLQCALPEDKWQFSPEIVYELRITDPLALMTHALNLGDRANELALLQICRDWVERAIRSVMSERIHARFPEWAAGESAAHAETCLRAALPDVDCTADINRLLSSQGRGVAIRNLSVEWQNSLRPQSDSPAAACCPHCGGGIPGTGADVDCPHCGRTAQWCPSCAGYRPLDPRRICPTCGRKRYF